MESDIYIHVRPQSKTFLYVTIDHKYSGKNVHCQQYHVIYDSSRLNVKSMWKKRCSMLTSSLFLIKSNDGWQLIRDVSLTCLMNRTSREYFSIKEIHSSI